MANTTSKRLQLLGAFPAPTDAQVKAAVDKNMAANPEKYVGPAGPQGPVGPQGPQGPQGPGGATEEQASQIEANRQAIEQLQKNTGNNSGGNANCLLTVETITVSDGESANVAVTGITLDYSNVSLTAGESMMLAASVSPSNATNNTVLWKSSNTSIAKVENGYVTAVAEGNAVITAYSAENNAITATCSVAVAAAESGGDSGGDGGNEGTGTGEPIPFSTLTPEATGKLMNKSGGTTALNGQYYKLPYSDGMVIVTRGNGAWFGNYPPFIVKDGDVFTYPEYESTTGAIDLLWTTTLTGFSNEAEVYVNLYGDSTTGSYYIPGGEA